MWFFKNKIKEKAPNRPLVAIRMEAIGGQGANSAGKILAEAAVLGMSYQGNHFSSFGSEKRGTPVRSFVRFSTQGRTIRSASFIEKPDLLMIFHENLLYTNPEVLTGVTIDTDILINSAKSAGEFEIPGLQEAHSVSTVDATKWAMKIQCGLNVVMLGAAVGLYQEIDEDKVLTAMDSFFQKLSSEQKKKNQEGFTAGKKNMQMARFEKSLQSITPPKIEMPPLGWVNAPIGGLITQPGNMIIKDHSVSRKGTAPKFIPEICFHCGFCDAVCPDFCFVWSKDAATGQAKLQGIDYQYCKGCQKCVTACPASAITVVEEEQLTSDDKSIHHPWNTSLK